MRKEEGGQRTRIDCVVKHNGSIIKFHPLSKVDGDWCLYDINCANISL